MEEDSRKKEENYLEVAMSARAAGGKSKDHFRRGSKLGFVGRGKRG